MLTIIKKKIKYSVGLKTLLDINYEINLCWVCTIYFTAFNDIEFWWECAWTSTNGSFLVLHVWFCSDQHLGTFEALVCRPQIYKKFRISKFTTGKPIFSTIRNGLSQGEVMQLWHSPMHEGPNFGLCECNKYSLQLYRWKKLVECCDWNVNRELRTCFRH